MVISGSQLSKLNSWAFTFRTYLLSISPTPGTTLDVSTAVILETPVTYQGHLACECGERGF